MSKQQIVNAPSLYVEGLAVLRLSNTTFRLYNGKCRDSNNVFDMSLASNTTINAAVNGVNGLDTGSFAASKCYAVFVIGDSAGYSATAGLMSLSATAPVLPTGYDIFRRVGWMFSDASTYFIHYDVEGHGSIKEYHIDEPIAIITAGTDATFTAVDLSEKVPAYANNLSIRLQLDLTPNAAGDAAYFRSGGSSATNGAVIYGNVAGEKASQEKTVLAKLVTGAPTIEYKVTASGSLNALLLGFIDHIE